MHLRFVPSSFFTGVKTPPAEGGVSFNFSSGLREEERSRFAPKSAVSVLSRVLDQSERIKAL